MALAGNFTLVSSYIDYHNPASAWLGHVTSSVPSCLGKYFSLDLECHPTKRYVAQPVINGFSYAWVDVYMKVKWNPDPGDPTPVGPDSGTWTVGQSGHFQLEGLLSVPGPSSVLITAAYVPDPNSYNFGAWFNSVTSQTNPFATVNNVPLGTFNYFTQGGDLYAEGVFRITLQVDGVGTVPAFDAGGVQAYMHGSATLTSIDGIPVL